MNECNKFKSATPTASNNMQLKLLQQWKKCARRGKMNVGTNEEHNSEVAGLLSTEAADMRMVMKNRIETYTFGHGDES